MGNALGPIFACRGIDGRGDEAEVAATIVGADVPLAIAVIDGVFVLVFAWSDELEFAGGLIGGEHVAFAGGVAGGFEHDVLAVAGAASADVEALIIVLVDEDVLRVRRVKRVAEELELALLLFVL